MTLDATTQRDRMAEAITREHYRRAEQRIEASPEEHGRAFADAAMAAIQAEPDQATNISPGQTLILRYTRTISRQQAEQAATMVAGQLPGINVVVVNCDQMLVYTSRYPNPCPDA